MGSIHDYVPIQLTSAFRKAQQNTKFRSWLDMQDAVMAIEFRPEVSGMMYTKESLEVVEAKILSLYDSFQEAWDAKNVHTTMRFVYYIGETYRRGLEGVWAALPKFGGGEDDNTPVVDFPFRETLFKPMESVQVSLVRRTGSEMAGLYPNAQRDFQEWVEAGRPERAYRGTLREDD
ncbi:hypothetical protein DE4585_04928 [Mycobacteroides salmoniphilum]|uniref:Uncharacterized protein n=2 Tax=Mycobacteroides salmoniphilum TaxID=404941 RepID=A0A4R8RWT9_9MYCO|nr:hypothetical protein DE4585_04928 [Mycobacteroides salmoniphilum]